MTRFARAGKRKFVEASTWDDLSGGMARSAATKSEKGDMRRKKDVLLQKKKELGKGLSKQTGKKMEINPKKQKRIEARRLRRRKWKCCFVCRQPGHQASSCPNQEEMKIGMCFKCGSVDHTTRKCKATVSDQTSGPFPFAKCFICQEMGHLAKSCPENPRGLYPQGGGCKMCGSVEHLKRDCPQLQTKAVNKGSSACTVSSSTFETSTHTSADAQDVQMPDIHAKKKHVKSEPKIVYF